MAEITYASIEPLLREAEELPRAIRCTFCCPVTGEQVVATGPLEKGRELEDVAPSGQGLLGTLRHALGGLFAAVLGSEEHEVEVARAADAAFEPYTDSERKAGIVLAFRSAADRFVWDSQAQRWISVEGAGELLTEFDRQLKVAPIRAPGDRQVAARMLVEVARTDEQVTDTEWDFLGNFIPGDLSSVDTYMEAPPLTAVELDATSRGAVRDTMLMLAWALAHVDHQLDADEDEQLLGYARGLKIPETRARELQELARQFLLEKALQRAYPGGELDAARHQDALALGEQLGLERAAVEAFEERFRRRWGIGAA
ncbi:MAG: hypothetical protein AB7N76_31120 [Planctomycetota bacterium]